MTSGGKPGPRCVVMASKKKVILNKELSLGQDWRNCNCPNYKRNDPNSYHCIYFKHYMQCVYNEVKANLLPEDLFEI